MGCLGPRGKRILMEASLANDVTVPTAPKSDPCVGVAQEGVWWGEGWWVQALAPHTCF